MKPRQLAVQFLLVVLLFSLGAALTLLPRLYKDRNRLDRNLKSNLPLSEESILEVLSGIDDPELDTQDFVRTRHACLLRMFRLTWCV